MTKSNIAEAAPPARKPEPELRRLDAFVGEWNVEGRQLASVVGPAGDLTGVERYEWLAGGFFLVHHFDARLGMDEAACIEITGYDASDGSYPTHTFYNNGQTNDWRLREQAGGWLLTGQWPMGGGTMQVRCTIRFSDGGRTRASTWESSTDGSRWETFWDVRATRK